MNQQQHSFLTRTRELVEQKNWQTYTWYAQEESQAAFQGMMNFDQVRLPFGPADFYLCGPVGFMRFAKQQLLNQGVASNRIHYEVFGPHEDM